MKNLSLYIMAFAFLLNGCVSHKQFIDGYTGHPSARVECSKHLDKSAEAGVQGAIVGDTNLSGGATSHSTIKGLRDDRGSIYEACLEGWAIRHAERKADRINECVRVLTFVFFPSIIFCYNWL